MQIDGVWVPPAELANNVHDRKIRKAIELLVKKYRCPIASSSGKAGYRLSEDPAEMEEMAREFDGRAKHCEQRAREIRTLQKPLARSIAEFRKTNKIVSQERLL
jgi:hypothetical protein